MRKTSLPDPDFTCAPPCGVDAAGGACVGSVVDIIIPGLDLLFQYAWVLCGLGSALQNPYPYLLVYCSCFSMYYGFFRWGFNADWPGMGHICRVFCAACVFLWAVFSGFFGAFAWLRGGAWRGMMAGMTDQKPPASPPVTPVATPVSVLLDDALPERVRTVLVHEMARHGVQITVCDHDGGGAFDLRDFMAGARPRLGAMVDAVRDYVTRRAALPDAVRVGPFMFSPADYCLRMATPDRDGARVDGGDIRLTEKERDLLWVLLQANGAFVARDVLLDQVWGFVRGVETHTLETHIYRLRQKIELDPSHPLLLQTDGDGEGYRLIVA